MKKAESWRGRLMARLGLRRSPAPSIADITRSLAAGLQERLGDKYEVFLGGVPVKEHLRLEQEAKDKEARDGKG